MTLRLKTPIAGVTAIAALTFLSAAGAQSITGAGASFPAPVYAKWAADYHKATGVKVNYQSIGSGAGIKQIDAKTVDLPMLILQGARDIQVVDADWQRWRGGFYDDKKVTFKLYDKLNHLGIAGEGEGNLAEYANPGHVDAQLIDDVATWVKAH